MNERRSKLTYSNRRRYFGDFRHVDSEPRNSISYDTCTFFDKHVDTANLHERYTKEIEQLRGKLRELKGDTPKFERRRMFDDLAYSPKELLVKTNTGVATINNVVANNNNANDGDKANEVSFFPLDCFSSTEHFFSR